MALAGHWYANGWRDAHRNYPPVPSGYSGITSVFGQPCKSDGYANSFGWMASTDGVVYNVRYHKKLGGSRSSNLDNDVRGHVGNAHADRYVRHGIYGYNCRKIAGSDKQSTHSWGIAVDLNSAYEHVGSSHHHCHSMAQYIIDTFKNHRWTHGVSFGDCMHYQYAVNY
jgi:hypothetical protein